MKKIFGILGIIISFSSLTHAGILGSDLECYGDKGETLTIEHVSTRTDRDFVVATLTKDNSSKKFFGSKNYTNPNYQMNDLDGEKISLKVTKIINHGGRCGRCAPSESIDIYAKLTVGIEELDFSCN